MWLYVNLIVSSEAPHLEWNSFFRIAKTISWSQSKGYPPTFSFWLSNKNFLLCMKNYSPWSTKVDSNSNIKAGIKSTVKSIGHCDHSLAWVLNNPGNFYAIFSHNRRIDGEALMTPKVFTIIIRYWWEQTTSQLYHFPEILKTFIKGSNQNSFSFKPVGVHKTRLLVHPLWVYWCCRGPCLQYAMKSVISNFQYTRKV